MALLLGFKKTIEGGTIDACGQVFSLGSGAQLDTLKHPFENAVEISSIDYSSQHHSFFGVDSKTNHVFVWSLQRKNRKYLTFNVGVKPRLLCLSPCGTFCAAAVGANIHIWQTASGNLLCILSEHFQPVSVLKFTDDSQFLVSGGEDGIILVWDLANCVATDVVGSVSASNDQRPPLYRWNEHSQTITDIAVGHGGIQARVFSCSLDHSFKIWDLVCGRLLLAVSFDVPLTALAVDASETRAFVATEPGRIVQLNIFAPPSSSLVINSGSIQSFDGHQSPCRNLAVCFDGLTLVSCGSTLNDRNVRIWDVASRQCLRVIKVKGEITEMRLLNQVPPGYDSETNNEQISSTPLVVMLKPFHRNIIPVTAFTMVALNRYDDKLCCDEEEKSVIYSLNENTSAQVQPNSTRHAAPDLTSLTETNRRLYDFMASRILSGELVGKNSSMNSSNSKNEDEDDLIIVEHSGEEEEDNDGSTTRNNNKRRKGRKSNPAVQTRFSNRLKTGRAAKRRGKNGLGDTAAVLD